MTEKEFIEEIFELAFGDNAINRNFTKEEVVDKMRDFTEDSYRFEQIKEAVEDALS